MCWMAIAPSNSASRRPVLQGGGRACAHRASRRWGRMSVSSSMPRAGIVPARRINGPSVAGGWHHLAGGSPPSSGSQRTFSPGRDAEIPIAGGEHLYDVHAFQELLQHRAVDIAIIDLARAGGITPWRRIAAHWPRPITCRCVATSSKFTSTCCRPFLMRSWSRMCRALRQSCGRCRRSRMVVWWLQTPGLGLELDDTAVTRYRVG